MEIVRLIGSDVLPDDQKLVLEAARIIRVGLLQQNAYHRDDTYVPLPKQYRMMEVILAFYDRARRLVAQGVPLSEILETGLSERIIKIKYEVPNDRLELLDGYLQEIQEKLAALERQP